MNNNFIRLHAGLKASNIIEEVDKEIGRMAEELATAASNDAPVKTGKLSRSLIDGAERVDELHWQVNLDIENVPYTWRQNFEHPSKRYFITRNFNEIEAQFGKRLQEAVKKKW